MAAAGPVKRVLDVIPPAGMRARDLHAALPGLQKNVIDVAVTALINSKRLTLHLGWYRRPDLPPASLVPVDKPAIEREVKGAVAEAQRRYYEQNKDRVDVYRRQYYHQHREKWKTTYAENKKRKLAAKKAAAKGEGSC